VATGTPISGTFSYDSTIFVLGGSNGNGTFIKTGSANPVVITITIAGSTFTVHGTIQSVLTLFAFGSDQNPNNHFYLEAANWGPAVPGLSGSIDLNLSNYLGALFASNIDDPSSVAFANQNGLGVNQTDTLQAIDSSGNGTAALYFKISNSSTVPGTSPTTQLAALLAEANGLAPAGLEIKAGDALKDLQATCTLLTNFVSQVQAQKKIGKTLAAQLISNADAIEVALGCSSPD
jgi:hypothetical protein